MLATSGTSSQVLFAVSSPPSKVTLTWYRVSWDDCGSELAFTAAEYDGAGSRLTRSMAIPEPVWPFPATVRVTFTATGVESLPTTTERESPRTTAAAGPGLVVPHSSP